VGSSYSTEKRIQRLPVLLYLDALENAMHYYKRNLGDYAKKAGRLSMLQHGSYTLLIDACYDREQFPTRDEALDWTWASSTAEIEAVDFVLAKFFTLEDGRYVQKRIQEEVAAYHATSETNKRIAMDREAKRNESSTKRERSVNEAPPNHKPLTISREACPTLQPGHQRFGPTKTAQSNHSPGLSFALCLHRCSTTPKQEYGCNT